MIHIELLEDGRVRTYSDTFKILQVDTGIVYDDAIDTVQHQYVETDIPLDPTDIDNDEFRALVEEVLG